ncbi:MAG TPA: cytochrome P450 [Phototrophicaceae bacterium]|nr:cytochrome P450 [Phototrophicaceae bacterium]
MSIEFNPYSPEFQANPYPYYDLLRAHAPILPTKDGLFLSRYDDCVAALKDPRLGREILKLMTREQLGWPEPPAELQPLIQMRNGFMLFKDPPTHTRLRTLVHKAFTPHMIERLRWRIQVIAHELIDRMIGRGSADLMADFALPLPVTVIAEMLGVPAADYPVFHEWTSALAPTIDLAASPEELALAVKATVEFSAYLRDLIAERHRQPQDDLISALAAAEAEGDKLSEDETVSMCILLLTAGHETTVSLIGNGMLALLRHPDQWTKLKADSMQIRTPVEELLRYDSPIQFTARMVMEPLEFAGNRLEQGQSIFILLGAANHDPSHFTNPNDLDITRDPNPHIAFGNGIHFCLGAPLARMEGQIAFSVLAQRLPNLQLVSETPSYRPTFVLRALRELPVTF